MKRSRFSEAQIVSAIRQAESGPLIGDLCRQLGVSEATCYTWKQKDAHLGVNELRRVDYNTRRPHRSLVHPTPSEVIRLRQEEQTAEEAHCSGSELSQGEGNVTCNNHLPYPMWVA